MEKDILYTFFEGTATQQQQEEVRKWMEASPENERTFFKERRLFDMMLLLAQEREPVKTKRSFSLPRPVLELLKIAAVVAITLAVGFFYMEQTSRNDQMAIQTISVPAGQRVNLTLPDGTNVWLNARTTLQYPVSFGKKDRRVELDGEAYFEVTKEEKRSFVVHTSKGKVEVLGTNFNVEAYSYKDDFETTLMQGSVKVTSALDPAQTLVLHPDSKAVLRGGKFEVVPVDDYNRYRWTEGLICFRNDSFESIMQEFEKYYGKSIRINNEKILNMHYTGKFRQTDGVDYALRVLQKDIRFSYSQDDENQIIYID
ncbi:MAG: FecR domain-containing protein [Tannerellaceae bacterium]|nr:FecR domain-containing protein [Tannerellaceae bacterium]